MKTKSPDEDNPFSMQRYVDGVVARGELYLELVRIQKLMIQAHQVPRPDREIVAHLTQLFKALLSAKQLREEAVHYIGDHNGSHAQNGSPGVAHHTTPRVGVGNILQENVPRG
jgi:hypothetical protein